MTKTPVVVWCAIALAVVTYAVAVSEKLQKLLGPLGRWITNRRDRRLQRAERAIDARVEDQGEQIAWLREQMTAMRDAVHEHERWDARVAFAIRQYDPEFPDPPPLYSTR